MPNLLEVKNLKKYYPVERGVFKETAGYVKALDGVSFTIGEKETLGLVGESGCGKTTCGRLVANLLKPTSGEVLFDEEDIFDLRGKQLKSFRKNAQIVFQDPYSSLNPRQKIFNIVAEPIKIHGLYPAKEIKNRVEELLKLVGLSPELAKGYPHQLSGGQRQRIGLARALALNPRLIVADEPISSLDISIQAQIINLMLDLQDKYSLSYLFISHDLGIVKHVAHRVAVMYLGKIVELADTDTLYAKPLHPYTKMLLDSVPKIKTKVTPPTVEKPATETLAGRQNEGCAFYSRCPRSISRCKEMDPLLEPKGEKHYACCWNPE